MGRWGAQGEIESSSLNRPRHLILCNKYCMYVYNRVLACSRDTKSISRGNITRLLRLP